jgi:hypothetical protein
MVILQTYIVDFIFIGNFTDNNITTNIERCRTDEHAVQDVQKVMELSFLPEL